MENNTDIIEQFKLKKMIKNLNSCSGNNTSLITLCLPGNEPIPKITKKLVDELNSSSNIKSRVNRQSVETAIETVLNRLKGVPKCPPNGFIMFCGESQLADGKVKKINIGFEPYKPMNKSMYMCDSSFHTEILNDLLESNEKYGFIIIDGNGALFSTLQGTNKNIILSFDVVFQAKTRRGGQSSTRYDRLRKEAYHNFIRKVSENATNIFVTNDMPNVKGLIIAGSSNFKHMLNESDLFDPRLKTIVIKLLDISYGMENGLNQAITLSSDILGEQKIISEKKILSKFFTEIAKDTNKYVFGLKETMTALETRSVETLIIYDEYDANIYKYKDTSGNIIETINLAEAKKGEILEEILVVDHLTEHYQKYSTKLNIVSNKSAEGTQFANAFKIGGICKYMYTPTEDDYDDLDEFDDFI